MNCRGRRPRRSCFEFVIAACGCGDLFCGTGDPSPTVGSSIFMGRPGGRSLQGTFCVCRVRRPRRPVCLDCHIVEAQATMLHFPPAENSTCALASPLPAKAVRLCGAPRVRLRNDGCSIVLSLSLRGPQARGNLLLAFVVCGYRLL